MAACRSQFHLVVFKLVIGDAEKDTRVTLLSLSLSLSLSSFFLFSLPRASVQASSSVVMRPQHAVVPHNLSCFDVMPLEGLCLVGPAFCLSVCLSVDALTIQSFSCYLIHRNVLNLYEFS